MDRDLPVEVWRTVAVLVGEASASPLPLVCKATRDACRSIPGPIRKRSLFEALHDPKNASWVIEHARTSLPQDHLAQRVLRLAEKAGGKSPEQRAFMAIQTGLRSQPVAGVDVFNYIFEWFPSFYGSNSSKEDVFLAIKARFAPIIDPYLCRGARDQQQKRDKEQDLVDMAELAARKLSTAGENSQPCLHAVRIAAWRGRHDMVKQLVENYLPPKKKSRTYKQVFHTYIDHAIALATARKHDEIAAFLMAYAESIGASVLADDQ